MWNYAAYINKKIKPIMHLTSLFWYYKLRAKITRSHAELKCMYKSYSILGKIVHFILFQNVLSEFMQKCTKNYFIQCVLDCHSTIMSTYKGVTEGVIFPRRKVEFPHPIFRETIKIFNNLYWNHDFHKFKIFKTWKNTLKKHTNAYVK